MNSQWKPEPQCGRKYLRKWTKHSICIGVSGCESSSFSFETKWKYPLSRSPISAIQQWRNKWLIIRRSYRETIKKDPHSQNARIVNELGFLRPYVTFIQARQTAYEPGRAAEENEILVSTTTAPYTLNQQQYVIRFFIISLLLLLSTLTHRFFFIRLLRTMNRSPLTILTMNAKSRAVQHTKFSLKTTTTITAWTRETINHPRRFGQLQRSMCPKLKAMQASLRWLPVNCVRWRRWRRNCSRKMLQIYCMPNLLTPNKENEYLTLTDRHSNTHSFIHNDDADAFHEFIRLNFEFQFWIHFSSVLRTAKHTSSWNVIEFTSRMTFDDSNHRSCQFICYSHHHCFCVNGCFCLLSSSVSNFCVWINYICFWRNDSSVVPRHSDPKSENGHRTNGPQISWIGSATRRIVQWQMCQ